MPKFLRHARLMRYLDEEYQKLSDAHYKAAPRNGDIPVGGGDWMDTFFRMEAIRGCLGALRLGKGLDEAIKDGEAVSEISIRLWTTRREWQVHRWEKTAGEFLKRKITHFNQLSQSH